MSSWIEAMASRISTCDEIINHPVNEALKKLNEEDVIKRSADTRFINRWVSVETVEGDPEYDEEDEYLYHMNGVSKIIIKHDGKYTLSFSKNKNGESPIDLEQIVSDKTGYLKGCLMSPDWWYAFTESTKVENPVGYSIAYILHDFCKHSTEEDTVDYLEDAQSVLSETFEFIKNYDAQGFTQYIHKKGIQIDERKGTIFFDNSILGGLFSITLIPES